MTDRTWHADSGLCWAIIDGPTYQEFRHVSPDGVFLHIAHWPRRREGPDNEWIVTYGSRQRTFLPQTPAGEPIEDDCPRRILRYLGGIRWPSYGPVGAALRAFLRPPAETAEPEPQTNTKMVT